MYQRHEQRDLRPRNAESNREEDFYNTYNGPQERWEQPDEYGRRQHSAGSPDDWQGHSAARYNSIAASMTPRRYRDDFNPNWMTRGGASEYRHNSSGQGDIENRRRWDAMSANGDYGDGQLRRNEPGEFVGRGPKGYSRSDQRMEEDINEELTRHPHLDATEIQVQVKDGVATLTGEVRTKQCKRTAEDIAEDVSGIRDVQNQLRVVAASTAMTNDTSGAGRQGRTTDRNAGDRAPRSGSSTH